MVLSIAIMCFMFILPKAFKRMAMDLIVTKNKNGVIYLLLSKVMWWIGATTITLIWVEGHTLILISILVTGFLFKLFLDRKALVLDV